MIKHIRRMGLFPRILMAIALGALLGMILPEWGINGRNEGKRMGRMPWKHAPHLDYITLQKMI